jgi:hypothetical protein
MMQIMCNFVPADDHRCASARAQLIWAESVSSKSDSIFPGRKCNSMEDFKNRVYEGEVAFMTPNMSNQLRGDFYVITTDLKEGPYNLEL